MAKKKVEQIKVTNKFELVKIDDIIPYVNNARKHPEKQINQICASLKEFGFMAPLLIDANNGLIAGHGRLEASRKLGVTSVPCMRAEHLTETQKKAYIIADNKLSLNSEWDEEMLALEFEELKNLDFSLDLTGFDSTEIAKAMGLVIENEPEGIDLDLKDKFLLIVECASENVQAELWQRLKDEGHEVKIP